MWELPAVFLAGLSLFFFGINGVKSKLQQLSSRRFRQILVRVTDRPIVAGLVGAGFGAVTQSASAVAFILSGMVAAGMITLRRALPVVAASNVGTALLVFLAAIDLRLAVLALIGVTGLMINFKVAPNYGIVLEALFAIGILFFGLDLMKQAFAPLPGFPWFQALAEFLRQWAWAPFLLGAVLRMVIQSSSAIGVIAIALQAGGLFSQFQAVMLVCGAGPGVALASLFLSGDLSGPPRQIILYQGLINLISGTVVGLLFALSEAAGHGYLFAFVDAVALDAGSRIAWTFFFTMTGCLFCGLLLAPVAEPLLRRWAPASMEQDLARPAFLHDEALQVPETAVVLADREQQRLFGLGLRFLDGIREDTRAEAGDEAAYYQASRGLSREIGGFLQELISRDFTPEVASAILALERRQENVEALIETLHLFVNTRQETEFSSPLAALMDRFAESLHLILHSAADAWMSRDAMDREYLLKLAADRGDMMERIRKSYQTLDDAGARDQSSALFYATTLFERLVWIIRQIGLSLDDPAAA